MDALLRDCIPSWRVGAFAFLILGGGFLTIHLMAGQVMRFGEWLDPIIFPLGSINNNWAEYFSVGLQPLSAVLFTLVLLLVLRLCQVDSLPSLLRDLATVPESTPLRLRLVFPIEWWGAHLVCLGCSVCGVLLLEGAHGEGYGLIEFPPTAGTCWLVAITSDRLAATGLITAMSDRILKAFAAFWIIGGIWFVPALARTGLGEMAWYLHLFAAPVPAFAFAAFSFNRIRRHLSTSSSA